MAERKTAKIPHPPRYPFIGNLPQIFGENTMQDLLKIAENYKPIFEMKLPSGNFYVATSHELAKVIFDDTYFEKIVTLGLNQLRHFAGDGLFTAHTSEQNWSKAHNILMPGFSMRQMMEYVPRMYEIAQQLVNKWQQVGAQGVEVTEDFTRLTLDTIALCGFDYRFNSFATANLHPFLESMTFALQDSLRRIKQTSVQKAFTSDTRWNSARDLMFETVDQLIHERLANSDKYRDKVDFLSLMLNGVDKASGSKMTNENIRFNLITFLVAGHETTSGLLSFASYWLMKNPDIQAKARAEVDQVLGRVSGTCPDWKQINKLRYVTQILKETLRMTPSVPFITRTPREDIMLGGKYFIRKGEVVRPLINAVHRDPEVWENPDVFDPERFSAAREADIPMYAFQPFGTGERACIGQHFSMVEATLCLAMVLQHFELKDDRAYELKIKETITLKPKDFILTLKKREDIQSPVSGTAQPLKKSPTPSRSMPSKAAPQHATPLAIYYGSNMGSCEDFARRTQDAARRLGFIAQVASLDDAAGNLPNTGFVLIISSTYNGAPPDNAKKFAAWIKSKDINCQGLRYAVLGCGNSQWKTYQAFPREIDERLSAAGAVRILDRCEADAAEDYEGAYEQWAKKSWPDVISKLGLTINVAEYLDNQELQFGVDVVPESQIRPLFREYDARPMRVMENRELQVSGGDTGWDRATRHLELHLPEGMQYNVGDHVGIIARNRESLVQAVAARLGYGLESIITLQPKSDRASFLPARQGISLWRLLTEYIDLQEIASRQHVAWLSQCCMVQSEKETLAAWSSESDQGHASYRSEILEKRRSVFDLLLLFKSCELPLDLFFAMASPIRPRFYSISSSPLMNKTTLSITVGVVAGPHMSQNGTFKGVASTFLQTREIGDQVWGFIRAPSVPFKLPEPLTVPMIMVGPGTGVAPFRGFLQEREQLMKRGQSLGEAHLFFGCRRQAHDFIYRSELEGFAKRQVCQLYVAYSHDEGSNFKFVQDRLWEQRQSVWKLLEAGAIIYVCGDGLFMAPDVRATFKRMHQEAKGSSDSEAEQWVSKLENEHRYVTDVFGQKKN